MPSPIYKKTPKAPETAKPSTLQERLAKNLASYRKKLGMTQAQLAERLDVDTETVSRFERGIHLPSLAMLERIAGVLHLKISELLGEAEPQPLSSAIAISAWLNAIPEPHREFLAKMVHAWSEHFSKEVPN